MGQASEGRTDMACTDTHKIFSVNPVPAFSIKTSIQNYDVTFVLDTGAAVTLLREDTWDNLAPDTPLEPWTRHNLVGVEGSQLQVRGLAKADILISGKPYQAKLIIVDGLTCEAILGLDFLEQHQCKLDIGARTLHFQSDGGAVLMTNRPTVASAPEAVIMVTMSDTRLVPANSELEVVGGVASSTNGTTCLLERAGTKVVIARAIVNPINGTVPVRLLNPTDNPVTIYKGTKIACMEVVDTPSLAISTIAAQDSYELEVPPDKRAALWEMVCHCGVDLSETEKHELFMLLLDFADIFADNSDDFGSTNKLCHQIPTGDSAPIRQPLRRIPPATRQEARQLIQGMLEKGVIRPSSSPWASPVVLVKKKDGSMRFCVDYRKVNAVTRKDAYPLPRVDDTLDTLSGSQWFSTLDLISGYWQVSMSPPDQEKTAFCTTEGLFEFTKMPFGLCNAPATFQRLMDLILSGLQWQSCLVYLDDIIIIGRTFLEHLNNLKNVFTRLREAGLKLQPPKCAFCQKKVSFLGHVVSADGVATDPSKLDKVQNWPTPTSQKDVQKFLGLANYYRRFTQDFAKVAKPLHKLTEKTTQFKWTLECQDSFTLLKQKLTSAPVLAFPDFEQSFILDTDASDNGIGAVLSQVDPIGRERVVAYASRTLSKPERRYCVTRKELLAVVYFINHFRPYLLGKEFNLRTDHGCLTWLFNFKEPEGQLARWIEKLQEYHFHIVHRPGLKHNNADAMSRIPCQQCGRQNHETEPGINVVNSVVTTQTQSHKSFQGYSTTELRQLQWQDTSVGFVLKSYEGNCKPSKQQLQGRGPTTRKLIQLWDQLEVKDGLL